MIIISKFYSIFQLCQITQTHQSSHCFWVTKYKVTAAAAVGCGWKFYNWCMEHCWMTLLWWFSSFTPLLLHWWFSRRRFLTFVSSPVSPHCASVCEVSYVTDLVETGSSGTRLAQGYSPLLAIHVTFFWVRIVNVFKDTLFPNVSLEVWQFNVLFCTVFVG